MCFVPGDNMKNGLPDILALLLVWQFFPFQKGITKMSRSRIARLLLLAFQPRIRRHSRRWHRVKAACGH